MPLPHWHASNIENCTDVSNQHTTLLDQGNKGVCMQDLHGNKGICMQDLHSNCNCQEAFTQLIMSCCYGCQPIQISESTTYQCSLMSYLLCA